MSKHLIQSLALVFVLSGCASGPEFDEKTYSTTVSPQQVAESSGDLIGSSVMWGGILISVTNLQNGSQLEVLAYPLQSSQRPNLDLDPRGRFLVVSSDFLEPLDFSPGRIVTVTGILEDSRNGLVGGTEYVYPVVQAGNLHLWSKSSGFGKPQIHFGFGLYYGS